MTNTYFSDKKLLERVRHHSTATSLENVDVSLVAEQLIKSYPEYERKNKRAFRNQVNRAISIVTMQQNNLETSNDKMSQPGVGSTVPLSGMNNMITKLYTNSEFNVTDDAPTELNGLEAPKRASTLSDPPDILSQGKRIKLTKNKLKSKNSVEESLRAKLFIPIKSDVNFSNVGGLENTLSEIRRLFIHFQRAELFKEIGIPPPTGILLQGPPGCGKTLLARAISGEFSVPMITVAGPELVSGISGESENQIRKLFDSATSSDTPVLLFLDELDAIAPRRDEQSKEMERRIVSQLLVCLDELKSRQLSENVFVLAATSMASAIDPSLRRAGRFDREIRLGIPNESARKSILEVICERLKVCEEVSLTNIAHLTPGYVGADLFSLAQEAALQAVNRYLDSTDPLASTNKEHLKIQTVDFESALAQVQPSSMREGFATIPNVRWTDVGALCEVKEELALSILAPVKYPQHYAALCITKPPGILLSGPPGCGKTLLAKALANEAGLNFLSIKGPELMNMYVGETERAIRQVFERARNSSPCVVFFDELDALCPRRSASGDSNVTARIVNQMLTEMDGMEPRNQVYFLGATNRADMIDTALLRPGRIDKTLSIGLPSSEERIDILKTLTKGGTRPNIGPEVRFEDLARSAEGFSGADLSALVHEASQQAFRECIHSIEELFEPKLEESMTKSFQAMVEKRHFDLALQKIRPSVK